MHFLIDQEDTGDYVLFSDYDGFVRVDLNRCSVELSRAAVEDLVRYLQSGLMAEKTFESNPKKTIDGTLYWTDNSLSVSVYENGGATIINLSEEEIELILCKLIDWLILG